MVHLTPLSNLAHLDLRRTKVSDAGLVHITQLSRLEYLGPPPSLVGLEGLRTIVVTKQMFSRESPAKLKEAFPNCEISALIPFE